MAQFERETDLCAAFLSTVPEGWTPYAETAGWDILLVHDTGFQIGIEAKLRLNPTVVLQAIDTGWHRHEGTGPDARALLVPRMGAQQAELASIARALCLTIITVEARGPSLVSCGGNMGKSWTSSPRLPKPGPFDLTKMARWYDEDDWVDLAPISRCPLPDYVPDVIAGDSSPVMLSGWKIKAMKICVLVERRGSVNRNDFRALQIDAGRWMDGRWLVKAPERGQWAAGPSFPAAHYRAQHPTIYAAVEADFETWAPAAQPRQAALL